MSKFTFHKPEVNTSCPKAIAPVVAQTKLTIAEGDGALTDLMPALAAGDTAVSSGSIFNEGCKAVRLTISYLTGDTSCSACAEGELAVEDATFVVYPGQSTTLPPGLVAGIQVETGDVDSTVVPNVFTPAPVDPNQEQNVYWDGCAAQCACPGNPVVPAGGEGER